MYIICLFIPANNGHSTGTVIGAVVGCIAVGLVAMANMIAFKVIKKRKVSIFVSLYLFLFIV